MKKYIAIMLFLSSLTACDPAQTLEFENKRKDKITVKMYFKGNNQSYKLKELITGDSLRLELKPNEKKVYNFGIGSWKIYHALDSLIDKVEKVEIITPEYTQIYKGKNQIEKLFTKALKDDRYKARIIIQIK